ncbi:Protein of unknown function [Cotesia congregata]|uniref:ZAD domain-containing protein n=1 Tax=Cotesia congregata TaxID=51543 RepID=A0A8J2MIC1_COTCN|nr:Protein of unknown function [Cotesia congregata]
MSASYNYVSLDVYVRNNTRVVVTITKMTGTCRLCLKESTKLSPIFCNKQGREHFFDLYRKIFICCGIDINEYDELSSFICNECVTKLNAAYDFRLVCQRSGSSYCRLQSHTSKHCICSNPNAETEIPKVKKVMKICQSTGIHGKYVEGMVEEIQDEEIHDSFQVNGISTINSDDNQVNGLSAKNADEKNNNSPDVSTTDRLDSSTVKSSTTGISINHESRKSSKEGNNNDIDDLSYEKRLEIARNKYKDILVLNKLNIPPKKTADLTKLTDFIQKGDSNNVDFGSVAGAKQKDVDDANSVKDIYGKNSQVSDNNKSINKTCEATIANKKNKSIDENADEQIKDTDTAVYVQPMIVGEFDHTYDLREQIVVTFDENIPVGEKIDIQLDDNQEISAIIFPDSEERTAAEEEKEGELDSFKGFTNEEQIEVAQVDEGIEEQAINAADQHHNTKGHILDQGNYVSGKGSNLIVKDSDSSIEKPKKYFKNNPQVPNKNKIIVDRKDKSLSSRKRSRSQDIHDVSEVSNVPAVKQDEFKRRKSGKTKKSSLDKVCENFNHDVSQEDGVVNSGNSIEVQAEVHVRERSPEYSEPTSKMIGLNNVTQGGVNRNKSQNMNKINVQSKIADDFDQILNLEDDIAIEVAHNIEILPDDAQSVDYTVGIPDDDIQSSSDNTQVPQNNLALVVDDSNKEFNQKKNGRINKVNKDTRLKNSKSKSVVDDDNDDEEEEKDGDQLPKDSITKNNKVLLKNKNKPRGVVAVKKNVKVKILSKRKLKDKSKFSFKKLKSKKKPPTYDESTEDETESSSDDDTSDIVQIKRSRIKQLSSTDENLVDRTVKNNNNNKKLNKSQRRKSSPVRPSNSGKMRKKLFCKYCDKFFLYRLPLFKHVQQHHLDSIVEVKKKQTSMENLDVIINSHKICRICLKESNNLSPLFSNDQEQPKYPGLAEKIRECGDIKLCEGKEYFGVCILPSMICDTCIENAKISYKFRLQCQYSAKKLQLYYEELIQNNLEMIRSQVNTPNDSQDLSKFTEDIQSSEEFDDNKEDLSAQDKLSSGNQVILQQFLDLTQLDL